MNASEWVEAFAAEVGGEPPDRDEMDKILKLAAVAAHSSERIAAPIACYVAGRTGTPLDEAIAAAEGVATE